MPRRPRVSPDRILDAAAVEFAARGFGGARVDRIARRARVNKAMLYYHFQSKQGLYRALLRRTFALAADRLSAIGAAQGTHRERVDQLIRGIADFIHDEQYFPAIMLREVAEQGAHLDRTTLMTLTAVPQAVGRIIQEGIEDGAFRPVNPLCAYFAMVAPIIFYLAAGPIRREIGAMQLSDFSLPTADDFVHHMQEASRRSLASDADRRTEPS